MEAAREKRVPPLVTTMLSSLSVGDEVAILPTADSAPQHTLEIARVVFVNVHLVRLTDQRVYSLVDGRGLSLTSRGYIVPASDAHRRAVAASPTGDAVAGGTETDGESADGDTAGNGLDADSRA